MKSTTKSAPWRSHPPAPPTVSGGLPLVGHVAEFLRRPHDVIQRGYDEHGAVFTVKLAGNDAVFLIGPEYHRFYFHETDRIFSVRKGYETMMKMFDPEMLFYSHLTDYQEQMKVILPLFKRYSRFTELMVEEVDLFTDESLGDAGTFEVIDAFGPLVMHVAARAFFGDEFRRKLGAEYFHVFRDFALGADVVLPDWLPLPKFRKSRAARYRIESMIYELMKERREKPLDPPDLFQELIEATYYDDKPLPDNVLVSLLLFLPWAGHETTVGHISWALIDILQHPEYKDRVMEELHEVLGDGDEITYDQLRKLKTLDWAIKEAERLHPIAHMIPRGARDNFKIDGFQVTEGTMVFVCPAIAHRIPEIFEDPERYDPDRFAPDRAEDKTPYSLIGFGGGVHRCLGVNFAKLEMKIILAKLLLNYDLTLLHPNPEPRGGTESKWPQSPCEIRYQRKSSSTVA